MSPLPDPMTRLVPSDRFVVFHVRTTDGKLTAARISWAMMLAAIGEGIDLAGLHGRVDGQDAALDGLAVRLQALFEAEASLASHLADEIAERARTVGSVAEGVSTLAAALSRETAARSETDTATAERIVLIEQAATKLGERVKAVEDAALRCEHVSGAVVNSGTAVAVTFVKPFVTAPVLLAVPSWILDQKVEPTATEITKTGAKVLVKRSRGTLALSAGPFENAGAGTPFTMLALGH